MNVKSMSANDALPLIEDTLSAGQAVRLRVTGSSMRPLFQDGRTIVTIAPLARPPHRRDILLCKYRDGLLLHRVLRTGATLTLRGDALRKTEQLHPDQVLGIVTHYGPADRQRSVRTPLTTLRVLWYRGSRWLRMRRSRRTPS